MARVYNFSAGPSMLPLSVLVRAQEELLDYGGSGQSVLELSHRSPTYERTQNEAEGLLREILGISDAYHVLFLQGGASLQFAMVPMNLFGAEGKADYIDTGMWSKRAIAEAKKYGKVRVTASSEDRNYSYVPPLPRATPDADYLHITTNNTIFGTRLRSVPAAGGVPLVADMSSNILSEPVRIDDFGLIYAGAQKNLGPAGVTVVIVRKDLVGRHLPSTPTMLQYKTHAENASLYNTPPCFAVYVVKLVLEEVKANGGLPAVYERNEKKAAELYEAIDSSRLYRGTAAKEHRSLMNVPFVLVKPELDETFLAEADAAGLVNLKGHRSVGGMRASIYNAMPIDGVRALVGFMRDFESRYAG